MKSSVILKGNKYGFQIVLNPTIPFEELVKDVAVKFQESRGFFDQNKAVAISFDGRTLGQEEQNILVDTIMENSDLNISYIIDGAKALESDFGKAIEMAEESGTYQEYEPEQENYSEEISSVEEAFEPEQKTEKNGQFYRGTLRSGQSIEVDGSIVILGDINPGAQVVAGGNVVVLGCLKGTVTAGYPNDNTAVVAALLMEPMQIKIGEFIARSPDHKTVKGKKKLRRKQAELEAKLAFVENDNIFIETITRSLISEFSAV